MVRSILNPNFVYVSSANTDLRRTFARVRQELHMLPQQPTDDQLLDELVRLRKLNEVYQRTVDYGARRAEQEGRIAVERDLRIVEEQCRNRNLLPKV